MTVNTILIISAIVIVFVILILYVSKKMCDVAIRADIAKQYTTLVFTPEQKEAIDKTNYESIAWLNTNAKEIDIISKDGLRLKGYEIKNKSYSDIWVIAIHGYMGRGADMVQYVQKFIEYGYNILIIDLRAHGKSEGRYIGMGWLDHYDLEMWIEKIIAENENCKIILYGISMGGATVMMTTGEKLPENIKVCIEDCGYTTVWEEFTRHIKRIFHMPTFPLMYTASLMAKINAGYGFKEASSIKQVKKSIIPTLFIHGDKDKFVPFEMVHKVYEKAKCPKEKLVIEDAAHAECSIINPEKYWDTIEEFIRKYI